MILVVDDHDDTRHVLIRLLESSGYEAVGVEDGNQALLFLQTKRPKLIILDCHMPCLDGFGVLRAVRAHAEWAHTPVLMFSADSTSEGQALRLGANGFLLKGSLDWARVSEAVERHAGNDARGGTPPSTAAAV
jgi:CheY-like chemotaxis protein